ncbi:MAG: M23 family peptidase, partial [Pontixanthobacter sp.]
MYRPHDSDGNSPSGQVNTIDRPAGSSWRAIALSHGEGKATNTQCDASQIPNSAIIRRTADWRQRLDNWRMSASEKFDKVDIAPDLAEGIGSRRWFRGLGTMIGLSAIALALWPDFAPLEAAQITSANDHVRDEYRSNTIMPLALGGDVGRRMGPTDAVIALADAPERPQLDVVATFSRGDSFDRMLRRAGVSGTDADRVTQLLSRTIDIADIEPGTQIDVTLGRRLTPETPRPLESLNFRARFDLALAIDRSGGVLSVKRLPIQV